MRWPPQRSASALHAAREHSDHRCTHSSRRRRNVLGAVAVTSRARWSMRALDVMVALSAGFMIAVSLGRPAAGSDRARRTRRGARRARRLSARPPHAAHVRPDISISARRHTGHGVGQRVGAGRACCFTRSSTAWRSRAVSSVSASLGCLVFVRGSAAQASRRAGDLEPVSRRRRGRRARARRGGRAGRRDHGRRAAHGILTGLRDMGLAIAAGVTLYVGGVEPRARVSVEAGLAHAA